MFNVYSTSLHPVFKHSVHPLKCWHCLAQPWTTSSFLPTLGFFHSWPSSCITASLCLNIFPINLDGTASNRAEKKGCKKKRSDPKYRAPLLLLRLYVTVVPQPVLLLRQLEFLPWSDGNAKKKKKHKEATPDSWSEPFSSGSICENYMCDLYSKWGNWLFGEQREEIWFSRKTVKQIL